MRSPDNNEPLSFGFSGEDDWNHHSDSRSPIGSSPLGAYPSANSTSPIGNSPIGGYPSANSTSPIGNSPLGGYPTAHSQTVNAPAPSAPQTSAPAPSAPQPSAAGSTPTAVSSAVRRNAAVPFIGWLIGSVLLTVIIAIFGELWIIPFSIFQLCAGLWVYFYWEKPTRYRYFKRFLIGLGGTAALFLVLRLLLPKYFQAASAQWLILMCCNFFLIIGVGMIVFINVNVHGLKKYCTETVSAMCVRVLTQRRRSGKHHTTVYCPVYEYYYQNKHYESQETFYSSHTPPEVGSCYDILINPSNPSEFYDIRRKGNDRLLLTVIGGFFSAFSIFMMLLTILDYAAKHLS